jgi:hypothetical protein
MVNTETKRIFINLSLSLCQYSSFVHRCNLLRLHTLVAGGTAVRGKRASGRCPGSDRFSLHLRRWGLRREGIKHRHHQRLTASITSWILQSSFKVIGLRTIQVSARNRTLRLHSRRQPHLRLSYLLDGWTLHFEPSLSTHPRRTT